MEVKGNNKRPRSGSSTLFSKQPYNRRKTGSISSSDDLDINSVQKDVPSSEESTETSALECTKKVTEDNPIYLKIGAATCGRWLGPMEPGLFLERFLPQVKENIVRPNLVAQNFVATLDASSKSEMRKRLIEAVSPFAPRLKLVETHSMPDNLWNEIASDISAYSTPPSGTEVNIANTDFSLMEFAIGISAEDSSDPFVDSNENCDSSEENSFPFEREGLEYEVLRGRIASHTSALFAAQFRIHAFSVLICGSWARLIRWDRNGAIVTKKFAYNCKEYLVEFLWRYSHIPAGDINRGHDPTVTTFSHTEPAQTAEEAEARFELVKANEKYHREFRVATIPDRDTGQEFKFLISYPPMCTTHLPFGRATRPMLAFDIDGNKLVFVKDYWRSVGNNIAKEGDVYKALHSADVPYIASFGKGNDVRNHSTLSDTVASEDWVCPVAKMDALRHYRMSLEDIGRPLSQFKSSHELVTAVADAMEAHEFAYHDAKILHRDISTGNILITREGRGMLIDWDLSLNMNNLQGDNVSNQRRIGTWEFLSVSLLTTRDRPQTIIDDKESSLYVILWNMLRYTRHNRMKTLAKELALFDEMYEYGQDGGRIKRDYLFVKHTEITFTDRPQLDNLLQELSYTFLARYERPHPAALAFFATPQGAVAPFNPIVRQAKLEDRKWLVRTFRTYLSLEGWPEGDAARRNQIVRN